MKIGRFAQVLLFIAVMFLELPAYAQIPTDGLVGYWSFDDGTANLTAGSANNGQPTSAVTFGPGKSGMAAVFQGVDNPGHIYIPNSAALQFTTGATYSVWVRVDALKAMDGWGNTVTSYGGGTVFAKSHDRIGAAFGFSVNSANEAGAGVGSFASWAAGQSDPLWTPQKQVGDWAHLTCIFSASSGIKIYVDGQLYRTSTNPVLFADMNGQDLFIGKFSDSWYPFYGAIDEVRIYNRVLSEAEVAELAGGSASRMRPVVTTLSTPTTPVIIGDQFNVNFTVSGATSVDTTYEEVSVDLLREDDQLLYPCREFTDIPVLAGSSWSNHATCQIPADKLPGKYKVVLSAKKAGQFTFYLPTEGAVNNPLEITANKSQPVEWDWLTVSGTVEDNQTNPVAGASVVLCPESSNDCRQTTTDNQGDFQVQYNRTSASPDDWKLTASIPCASGSGKDSIDIHLWNGNYTNTYHQNLQVQCNDGVKLPVIVVPGVFGSTLATSTDNCSGTSSGCYPAMGETLRLNSEKYKILSPYAIPTLERDVAGSEALISALRNAGYPVISLPWDWRIPTDEAAGRYLKKMIDTVKADYNVDKVHVVAHSQGGLLARAYIQGLAKMKVGEEPAVAYGGDIAKLVMLGTPNGGAANPYWMLEGGEPLEIDNLVDWIKNHYILKFYSTTTNNLYKMRNKSNAIGFGLFDDYKIERSALVNFYHTEAPGARSLMAQNNLLTCTEDCSASSEGNAGQFNNGVGPYLWLHDNLNVTNLSNLGKLWETNKVQTHLILSNNVETIDTIKTKNNTSYNPDGLSWSDYKAVYKYGIPKQIQRVSGDGTVSVARARKPLEDVVTISTVAAGEHASLMKTLAPCVVATLDNGTTCSDSMVKSMVQAKTTTLPKQDGVVPSLHLTVNGMPQPQLVDPAARATGINATGTVEENIPDTKLLLLGENSAITVSNPASGDYILNLRGQVASEYTVMITYIDSTGHLVELSLNGVHDAGEVTSIPFTLNPTVTDMVEITPVIGAPGGFLAASSNGNVLLSWNVVSGASGYRIYSKRVDMAEFSLLGTTTATQYQTDIPWDENGTGTQWFFYVVALTADGPIGTFDKSVDNRPLVSIPANFIKTFPWPMFLPAITHGVKHP